MCRFALPLLALGLVAQAPAGPIVSVSGTGYALVSGNYYGSLLPGPVYTFGQSRPGPIPAR